VGEYVYSLEDVLAYPQIQQTYQPNLYGFGSSQILTANPCGFLSTRWRPGSGRVRSLPEGRLNLPSVSTKDVLIKCTPPQLAVTISGATTNISTRSVNKTSTSTEQVEAGRVRLGR
jgi:hypothetical protein